MADAVFAALCDKVSGAPCWKWRGEVPRDGCSVYEDGVGQRRVNAQIYAYQDLNATKPPHGLDFRHYICRTMGCVNPEHVRPV